MTAKVPPIQLALPANLEWLPLRVRLVVDDDGRVRSESLRLESHANQRRFYFANGAALHDFLRAMPFGANTRLVRLGPYHFHVACDQEEGDDMRFPYHIVGEVHVNVVPRVKAKKYHPLLAYGYE